MKPTLYASAASMEDILALVNRRYYGGKKLVQTAATIWRIEGCKNGVPYLHENDWVVFKRGRFRHESILK